MHVVRLLDSCDLGTAVGRRDHAMLTLLVRLGLRAGEVAALELGDFDWRRGEVIIRGKGDRQEPLPLPVDVGEAVSSYLHDARPRVQCRRLFLRVRAPLDGELTASCVKEVVRQACRRAGLAPVGAHRLRHTAATELLRAGATLAEVGQVLRHRSLGTTAIYAKVDRTALRELARPWPGAPA
jgi:site-specific recombinase XerD